MEAAKALAVVAALALTALALAAFGTSWLGQLAGPQGVLAAALAQAEARGLEVEVPGVGRLWGRARFQRVQVTVRGESATAVATLDFTGKVSWDGREVVVSSLGYEQVDYRRAGPGWETVAGPCPRLQGIVAALAERARGLPERTPTAWYVRSERGEVEVTEAWRSGGDEGHQRLTLRQAGEAGRFRF